MKNHFTKSYFETFLADGAFGAVPSWIANLGVVPLLRLAAFLLAPMALCLALRRFSVTAVLEAINISSKINPKLSKMKLLNLTVGLLFVKALLSTCIASETKNHPKDFVLAKGEQKEISLENLKHFSVGNPDVISYKVLKKQKKILIKGKKVGFTDLVVWTPQKKQVYNLYVLSKKNFLKTFQLADALKNLNLTLDIRGPLMSVSGVISDFSDYLYVQKIKSLYEKQIFFKVKLDSKLRNEIVFKIYKKLYANHISSISCQENWIDIVCFYSGFHNESLLKELSSLYKVSFIKENSGLNQKNYRLKLKLIQLEKMDGQEIHIGIDKLRASVKDLFEHGLKKLIDDNIVFLTKAKMDLSSLAEPEIVISIETPQQIEIGSQIPFQNINIQAATVIAPIEWRFAGLKIKTKISDHFGKLLLKYETEFSRPVDQSISGSRERASAIIELNKPIKIFQIGFQTTTKSRQGIPLLSDVPLLKHLFESKSDQKTYKQIYGYVIIEETN